MQLKSIIELIEENKTDFFSYLHLVVSAQKKLCVKGDHFKFLISFKKKLKTITKTLLRKLLSISRNLLLLIMLFI